MKLRSTALTLLICLTAIALSSASLTSTINVFSQESEYRQVDLSVLGVATGPYSSPAVKDTQSSLMQPITASTSTFIPQILSDVHSSTIELGNGLSQRAQLFTQDADETVVQLSITSIQSQNDGTVVVTEIGTYQLQGLLGSTLINPSVSLFSQNNGVLLFSSGSNALSQIQLFSVDTTNKITIVQTAQALSVNAKHIVAQKIAGQIYFLSFQGSNNNVWLTQVTTGTATLKGSSSIQACQSLNNQPDLVIDLISTSISLTLRCYSANGQAVIYEQYSINQSDKTLLLTSSSQLFASVSSVVQDVQRIGNTLFVLESISLQINQLQILEIKTTSTTLEVGRVRFSTSLPITMLLQAVLSPSVDLVTIISDSQILGINVQTQELTMNYPISSLTTVSLEDFNPFTVHRYQNLIIISLAQIVDKTVTFQALPFYSNIPMFTFIQPATQATFSVSLPTSLNKAIVITAYLLTGIYPTVIYETAMNPYAIAQQNQAGIYIDLTKSVKGSDITYQISKFAADQKLTITSAIKQISNSGNGLTMGTQQFTISDIQGIYSTSQQSIALLSLIPLNNQYRYVYVKFQQGNGDDQLIIQPFSNIYTSSTSTSQVDPSGSFSLVINGVMNVQILQETTKGFIVVSLPTTCASNNSFLFASLPSSNLVATTCNNNLQVYTYTSNDNSIQTVSSYLLTYPTQKLTLKLSSIQISSLGILRITDNVTIFQFDLTSQLYLGFASVPAATLVTTASKIFLFSDSFIYATETTLTQLGYNSFSDQEAIVLRQLTSQAYTFDYSIDFSTIIQSFDSELLQEYLIVPGKVTSSGSLVNLIYKINFSTALDQLYTKIAGSQTQTSLFGLPNFLGYIDTGNNQIYIYSFSFTPTLVLSYSIGQSDFESGIDFLQTAILSYTTLMQITPQNINLNLQVVRDLQTAYGAINTTNSQVQSLQNIYLKNTLQSNTELSFTDTYLYNANLLGWQLPQSQNAISLTGSIVQRASISQAQNTDKLSSFVTCYPDIILSAKNGQISLNTINIMQVEQPAQIFFDSGLSSMTTTKGVSSYQITFSVLFYNNAGTSTSSDFYRIQVTCDNSTSTIALTGQIAMTQYTYAGLYFNQISSIITDPNLGLIGLLKSYSSGFYTVNQLIFDAKQVLTFNPTTYQQITNLQILSNYFNTVTNSIVFFAQDGYAYYSFSADLSTFSVVTILNSLIGYNQNVQYTSILTQATVLSNGNFLLEFDQQSLFYVSLTTSVDKVITLAQKVSIIHQERYLKFTGQAFVSNSGQIIIVSRQQNALTCVVLIYQPYPQFSNHYVAIESAVGYFPVHQNNLQFADSPDGQSILILLSSQLLIQSNTFTLTQSQSVDVSINTVNISNGFQGKAFGICPVNVDSNEQNTIILSAKISGGTTPTSAGLMRFQIIGLAIISILGWML